jgi:histidinol-phosphate aminotransferase
MSASDQSDSTIPATLPLRNDLIGEEPYGAPQLDVPVCLNVNENPYPPDPKVVAAIAERVAAIAPTLNRYPDREHIELRQAFSDYLARESGVRLKVEQLWGANGSNEIMLQLFQAFGGPGRNCLGRGSHVLHVPRVRARHLHHMAARAPQRGLHARRRCDD